MIREKLTPIEWRNLLRHMRGRSMPTLGKSPEENSLWGMQFRTIGLLEYFTYDETDSVLMALQNFLEANDGSEYATETLKNLERLLHEVCANAYRQLVLSSELKDEDDLKEWLCAMEDIECLFHLDDDIETLHIFSPYEVVMVKQRVKEAFKITSDPFQFYPREEDIAAAVNQMFDEMIHTDLNPEPGNDD